MSRQSQDAAASPARDERRWDEIFKDVLRTVLSNGDTVSAVAGSKSIGSGRVTRDIRNFQFVLENPRDRILSNSVRRLDVFGAVARFMWMISGNDRLQDIAFYEPRVRKFTDDRMTVPGSNYGKRLLMPEPGLDQVRAMIARIKEDAGTRRAVAAIYRPEDAVRDSNDIPCAFGIAFHVRNDRLHMTTIMRSNAAWTLLPYNVFEFTLLGELVSVLTGVPLGTYTHNALSMHLYEASASTSDEIGLASKALEVHNDHLIPLMEAMPPTSWDDLARVTTWEADLRYAASGLNVTNYRRFMDRSEAECHPYWSSFCLTLLTHALMTHGHPKLARTVLEKIPDPFCRVLDGHPKLVASDAPSLEEDPVLLSSRESLLSFAARLNVDEAAREELWGEYEKDFLAANNAAVVGERRRQEALRVADWERRYRERSSRKQEPQLF